jgi:hypothetical protein
MSVPAHAPASTNGVHEPGPRMHTTMLAVDICAFGDQALDDVTQLYLRKAMYELLTEAFQSSRIPWRHCHHEDRGDGVLVVAPADVPIEDLLDVLIQHLARGLREHNKRADPLVRLRLRLAVHTGLVSYDAHGVAGRALIRLFRLLNARAFRDAITGDGADLAVIVSEQLYRDAVDHGGLADPGAYKRIRVTCKETRMWAWVRFSARPLRPRPGPCPERR